MYSPYHGYTVQYTVHIYIVVYLGHIERNNDYIPGFDATRLKAQKMSGIVTSPEPEVDAMQSLRPFVAV